MRNNDKPDNWVNTAVRATKYLAVGALVAVSASKGRDAIREYMNDRASARQECQTPAGELPDYDGLMEENKPKVAKGRVVLDPGHGYNNRNNNIYDPGAVASDHQEADIALSQALKIRDLLEAKGYEVVLTRYDNKTSTPLSSRSGIADNEKADLMVSLHCNAASPSANGYEIFCETGDESSDSAADAILNSMSRHMPSARNRGTKTNNFRVFNGSTPTVLVESGFITNSDDLKYLTDNDPDVEQAIAEGIDDYLSGAKQYLAQE
ncbi:hypothetical protein CL614_05575 [archaeon]|nr:hypothetical protein [archaeon]|tara:strand:- start:3348 stop:4142 length:795 start_codon:yes stop_codon:yes gene_type:complete